MLWCFPDWETRELRSLSHDRILGYLQGKKAREVLPLLLTQSTEVSATHLSAAWTRMNCVLSLHCSAGEITGCSASSLHPSAQRLAQQSKFSPDGANQASAVSVFLPLLNENPCLSKRWTYRLIMNAVISDSIYNANVSLSNCELMKKTGSQRCN